MTTITINKRTKAGKTLFDLATILASNNNGVSIVNKKTSKEETLSISDEIFLKKLKRSALHAREIGAGTRKGNSLKALMDEL